MATFLGRTLGLVEAPRPIPSPATYKAIAAGGRHSCAIRSDGAATCWGHNYYGQSDAPEGTFKAITAGEYHVCGLRTDNTIECWDSDTDAPDGTFKAITVGDYHTCGLRTDNTIECWGRDHYGSTDPPEGRFIDIAAGPCGVRSDLVVVCWGSNAFRTADPVGASTRSEPD